MARTVDKNRKVEIKRNIMDASVELILEKGFSKFTLSEVAEKINVTKATIYWYFSSKNDLIMNISNHIWSLEIDRIKDLNKLKISATEKLKRIILCEDDNFSCVLVIKFLLEYYSDKLDIKSKIQEGYHQFQEILIVVLQEGKQNGEFHYEIPEKELASFIISSLDGVSINSFTLDKNYPLISIENLLFVFKSILKFEEHHYE